MQRTMEGTADLFREIGAKINDKETKKSKTNNKSKDIK